MPDAITIHRHLFKWLCRCFPSVNISPVTLTWCLLAHRYLKGTRNEGEHARMTKPCKTKGYRERLMQEHSDKTQDREQKEKETQWQHYPHQQMKAQRPRALNKLTVPRIAYEIFTSFGCVLPVWFYRVPWTPVTVLLLFCWLPSTTLGCKPPFLNCMNEAALENLVYSFQGMPSGWAGDWLVSVDW